jgi:phosphate-selective porin
MMSFKLKQLVASALTGTILLGSSSAALADSTSDIVNALVAKGVLTEEEGALLTRGRSDEIDTQKKKESKFSTNAVKFRGYVQVRNTAMLGGDEGVNLWSDRSVGDDRSLNDQDKNFLIRRARIIVFGDVGERLSYYIQPDFASSIGGTSNSNASGAGNFAQLRDAYGDVYLTKDRVHRVRVGQSKVPFGFENLQSSQNRLALDRADALNSAVRDERDLGAFYYYTPKATQELFEEIQKAGLKHSGNYGQFGIGVYNGQGANARDRNDNLHVVARYTHPWKTESGQIYEVGVQGYSGNYVSTPSAYRRQTGPNTFQNVAVGNVLLEDRNGTKDERVGVSLMMYPQPFGLQAEWNWGTTPGLDTATNTIREQNLHGGYVQAMYKIDNVKIFDTNSTIIPFVRWQYFDGFNKAEANSPENHVNDWEVGAEWQIAPEVELVAYYHKMKRSNLVTGASAATAALGGAAADYEKFDAEALRVQLQYNF